MTTAAAQIPARTLLRVWLLAARPRTLTAAVVPVLVGTAIAAARGAGRALPALAALLGSLLIQIGTNLANDYYDFRRGADTTERLGPTRVTQTGLVAPARVRAAAFGAFGLAALCGVYLSWVGGWPIALAGALSILSGYAYTGGPWPLGYHGLGDLFVLVFFGFVAVVGTVYVQAHAAPAVAWIVSVPVGALATAILVVNNLRDIGTDAKSGKRTLAVRLGARATRGEYVLLLGAAFAAPPVLVALGLARPWALLPLLALPLAVHPLRLVLHAEARALNPALGGTARLQLAFGILFALGLLQ